MKRKLKLHNSFFSDLECQSIIDSFLALKAEKAKVNTTKSTEKEEKSHFRNSLSVDVQQELKDKVIARLKLIKEEIEVHFETALEGIEEVQGLIYRRGHFFKPHRDVGKSYRSDHGRDRKITAVIMLNSSHNSDKTINGFQGGELVLFELLDKPEKGFVIEAKQGRLVLFPSSLLHEVKPLIEGNKYSLVTWFY